MNTPTYKVAADRASITCLLCGRISCNPTDIEQHYCADCHVFHDELVCCAYCDEPILPGERLAPISNIKGHWECGLRAAVGGLNHQLKLCCCCGGSEPPDPPNVSRRLAALLAAEHFYATQRASPCEPEEDA